MSHPTLGSIVGGKYRIIRPLGEGGMGAVYEAEHLLTLKHAAIKWVHPESAPRDVTRGQERLLHEARATSRVRHRNVVDMYDVLREGDAVCLVMQLLVGEPLSERMARDPMPLHEFIGVLLPAMRGMVAAHAAGVIHRDIKPENIFLAREPDQVDPVPKVIDFGISKVFDPDAPRLTRSGITMGTPRYVSYEQLLGTRDVDGRADVYGFGVMLYEAITGEAPYHASTFGEQAVAFAMSVPKTPKELRPELPEALDALVREAIAKDREKRVPDMQSFVARLEPFALAAAYPEPLETFVTPVSSPGEHSVSPNGTTAPATNTPKPMQSEFSLSAPWSEPPPSPSTPSRTGSRALDHVLTLGFAIGLAGVLAWWAHASRPTLPRAPSVHAASAAPPSATPQPALPTARTFDASPAEVVNERAAPALKSPENLAYERAAPSLESPLRTGLVRDRRAGTISKASPTALAPTATQVAIPAAAELVTGSSAGADGLADPLGTHRAGPLTRDEF